MVDLTNELWPLIWMSQTHKAVDFIRRPGSAYLSQVPSYIISMFHLGPILGFRSVSEVGSCFMLLQGV